MITINRLADAIAAVAPAISRAACMEWAQALHQAMDAAGILANPRRAAAFLGQTSVESMGFRVVVENLNYAAGALVNVFGSHRIDAVTAARIGRTAQHPADQMAIANQVYGGTWGLKNLGNSQPGDGFRFRGKGLVQLSGRSNVSRFAATLTMSADAASAYLETKEGAAASAVWFWTSRNLNELSGIMAQTHQAKSRGSATLIGSKSAR